MPDTIAEASASPGYDVSFTQEGITLGGLIASKEEAEKVIKALSALKELLSSDVSESETVVGSDSESF